MRWHDFVSRAVEVPFAENGRDWDGWDCWGLVVCAYKEMYGVQLPPCDDEYRSTAQHSKLQKLLQRRYDPVRWVQLPRGIGNIALILRRGAPVHVGIAVTPRDILHTEKKCGTIVERDKDLRVDSFWRPTWAS